LGEEGDALDYLFEKVESLVCAPSYDDPEHPLENTVLVLKSDSSIVERGDEEEDLTVDVEEAQFSADDELDDETKQELWYREPKYMMLLVLLLLIIVVLVANGVLLLTKW
jgi:hypothetical protein